MKKITTGITLSLLSLTLNAKCADISDLDVLAWAYKSMMATHTYNFTNANAEMIKKNAENYYTKAAWNTYYPKLLNSGIIDKVKKEKLVASAGVDPAPVILKKGDHTWEIRLPLILNYQSASENTPTKEITTLDIIYTDNCQLKIAKMTSK